MTLRRRIALLTVIGVLCAGTIAVVAGVLGGATGTGSAGVADSTAGSAATGWPADGSAVVAFYGDSYTRGTGASSRAARWSTIVCAERGWTEVNPSTNGLGFVNNRANLPGPDLVDQVIKAQPDIVISTMGLNDNFVMPGRADDVRAAIDTDFTELKKALPHTRFIIVEPFWYTDERPESVERIIGWVRDAAVAIDADYIPGASHWMDGHPEWKAADSLHPNDVGYREIAVRMDAELAKLGL
ncbi:SGNH/GDSL hydrolase family protein [Cryobacterium sp. HLT2-28]|uniref:SGNH/GDSL hydrolase family protein n=1 Tax=Cryobacterium sp. HLT2-28 TaxID=1259146 RepID=UPI001069A067|nr:SGNH/GDSL hydrolase family protein [Cryobacterium sp. HLT2-28]TFB92625.1 SGNH/GDSL hydrolase family protein [Cryobacterium sp. HLT2-28]